MFDDFGLDIPIIKISNCKWCGSIRSKYSLQPCPQCNLTIPEVEQNIKEDMIEETKNQLYDDYLKSIDMY